MCNRNCGYTKIGLQYLVKDQPKSEDAIILSCKIILLIILSYNVEARYILDAILKLPAASGSVTTWSV